MVDEHENQARRITAEEGAVMQRCGGLKSEKTTVGT
jgi:hypothetical protein